MKRVLCYGDSNTYGCDTRQWATGRLGRYDEDTRWTGRLQKLLGDDYCVIEEGLNGRTTVFDDVTEPGRNGFDYLEIAFKSHDPINLFVVMLGTNDLRPQFLGGDPVTIFQGMQRIIIRLKQLIAMSLNPKAQILIVAPPKLVHVDGCYLSYEQAWIDKQPMLAMLYRNLAGMFGCHYADASQWAEPSAEDGVHLDPAGHKIFAEKMEEQVRTILEIIEV